MLYTAGSDGAREIVVAVLLVLVLLAVAVVITSVGVAVGVTYHKHTHPSKSEESRDYNNITHSPSISSAETGRNDGFLDPKLNSRIKIV